MVSLTAGLHEDALHHSVRILPPNLVILIKLLQNILHTLQSRIFIAFEHKVSVCLAAPNATKNKNIQ